METKVRIFLLGTCFKLFSCLRLFFDPEYRDDIFLRNVGCRSTDYMALYPRRQNSSLHIHFNILRSYKFRHVRINYLE
jgi:hypothetical protein